MLLAIHRLSPSYAGFIICDYVRSFGEDAVAGISFAGAAVTLNTAAFGTLIGPGFVNTDFGVGKKFRIRETMALQFQANFFNAFNRTIFSSGGNAQTFIINAAPPDLSQTSLANSQTVFGIMAAQQNGARSIQFGLRLEF